MLSIDYCGSCWELERKRLSSKYCVDCVDCGDCGDCVGCGEYGEYGGCCPLIFVEVVGIVEIL
jgi:hypothetical protein